MTELLSHFAPLVLPTFLVGLVEITPAGAAPVKSLGANSIRTTVPTLNLWQDGGLNINFIPTGETVKKVWLDDISRIAVDFDGQLCSATELEGCETAGASVIHLRRIAPINFPGMFKTNTTLLSVVTEKDGNKQLYQFRIAYGTGTPQYHGVAIVPDFAPVQPTVPDIRFLAPAPNETQTVPPVAAITPRASVPLELPQLPPPPQKAAGPILSGDRLAEVVEVGLASLLEQKLISQERNNLALDAQVRQFVSYLRQGFSTEESATKADIPLYFVNTLERMGTKK